MAKSSKTTTPIPKLDFSKLAKLILQDLNNPNAKKNQSFFNKYKREDVIKYLERPQNYAKQLRKMSEYLYIVSPQYRRLINYFATLHLMFYVVEPYYINYDKLNQKMFEKTYHDVCLTVENMNLRHELLKAKVTAWREDVFYGYVHQTKDSFFLQKLPSDYCEITGILGGCYTYSFDFSYFNGKDEDIFLQFPSEFEIMYQIYRNNPTVKRWQEVNSDKCFCLKISEDVEYPLIPFCSVFASLYDIEEYKSLQKTRTALGAYSLLAMTMPLKQEADTVNPYVIDPDEVKNYYNFIATVLPPEIGLLLSPTKLEPIKFDEEKSQVNRVSDSNAQFWNESGVSQLLMSSADGTGASLAKSVITDEALSWSLVQQIQRNVNRLIDKFNSESYRFKVEFLPATIFNHMDLYDKYINASTYGLPMKLKAGACLGITPNAFNNMLYLENTVLKLTETMIPMQSSNTLSSDENKGGTPTKKPEEKTASTERTDANDANNPDNRNYSIDYEAIIE